MGYLKQSLVGALIFSFFSMAAMANPLYETALIEVEEALVQSDYTIVTPKGRTILLDELSEDDIAHSIFSELSAEDKIEFQKKRLFFLSRVASVLEKNELRIGFSSLLKNKLYNVFRSKDKKNHALDGIGFSSSRLRGSQILQEVIDTMDKRLWMQAPIVASQNEFAVSLSISAIGLAGVSRKGTGGSAGLGINVGMNLDSKALVFEIFSELDVLENAHIPTFMLGLTPKIGFIMKEQRDGLEMKVRTGYTFYPPGVPGFVMSSSEMVVMGFNSSIMSFPPLVGDAFTYTNRTYRKPLLRITVSPLVKYFLRAKLPVSIEGGPYLQSIKNLMYEIKARFLKARNPCENLLSPADRVYDDVV